MQRVEVNKNNIDKSNLRLNYIDIARGIAIILMVLGHIHHIPLRTFIFSFHMPLFIIVSGMFFNTKENLKDIVKKIVKNLFIPYMLAIWFTHILNFIFYKQSINVITITIQIFCAFSNKKIFNNVDTVGALWFIPFLIVCKFCFYFINKFSKENDLLNGVICTAFTLFGIYLGEIHLYLPWSIDVAFASMIFYYFGYILKKYELLDKNLHNVKVLLYTFLIYEICLFFGQIELATRSYPYGFICYITAMCGTIIIFGLSNLLEKTTNYISRILQWYGKNSLYILLFHHLETIVPYSNLGIIKIWQLVIIKLLLITFVSFIWLKFISMVKNVYQRKLKLTKCF